MKKNQIILISIGVVVLIGLVSGFICWLKVVKSREEVKTPASFGKESVLPPAKPSGIAPFSQTELDLLKKAVKGVGSGSGK